jgi:hypothetical protein
MNLFEVAREISDRLQRIFLLDDRGRRPVYGGAEKLQGDPRFRDHILFYEYFNGDNGAGVGASHQTGWTALVAPMMQLFAELDAQKALELGKLGELGHRPRRVEEEELPWAAGAGAAGGVPLH